MSQLCRNSSNNQFEQGSEKGLVAPVKNIEAAFEQESEKLLCIANPHLKPTFWLKGEFQGCLWILQPNQPYNDDASNQISSLYGLDKKCVKNLALFSLYSIGVEENTLSFVLLQISEKK